MTNIEQSPNELLSMCLSYLDFYNIYEIFFHLNFRFNQLIRYETKLHLHLSSIPSGNFLQFCYQLNQYTKTTRNYPYTLIAEDKHKLKLILEDEFFTESFSKLRTLILSNIDSHTLAFIIFDCPTKLYENLENFALLENITEDNRQSRYNLECKNILVIINISI
ncbi:unnamed protein product [Adineta steineri]|uniref:F-box domain-containing protein n=1 Tax=Adineta steineri TaxID=433720 RepID=A0A820A5A1_9BILA|nr:unnamed protein product [Adineta steineri]